MILSDQSKQPKTTFRYGRFIAISVVGLIILALLIQFLFPLIPLGKEGIIQCDAEHIRGRSFVSYGNTFGNGDTQNNEQALSGNFSSKVNRSQPRGMLYRIRNPQKGDRYKASVWRYRLGTTGGELVVKGEGNSSFEKRETLASEKNEAGWELLEITFNVPEFGANTPILIYVFTNTSNPIYFDDLTIKRFSKNDRNDTTSVAAYDPMLFKLEVGDVALKQLNTKRQQAIQTGVLTNSDLDWVEGKINQTTSRPDVKLRLKGNRLYNLMGNKWSFKVRVKEPYAWNRIKTFSLQNPAYKSYLREWIFHQLLEKEDIITPRYDFINLQLNTRKLGIYSYEEHFDRPLLEYHERKPGVIVRFSEDAHWANFKRQFETLGKESKNSQFVNVFDASQTDLYRENKILNEDTTGLSEQFMLAASLMNDYKYQQKPITDIFDVDRMAKYYAIMDVMQAYHSFGWKDQRFYYNPISSKLEPIGYGGFGVDVGSYKKRPYIGHGIFNRNADSYGLYVNLFLSKSFVSKYCYYLNRFSSRDYIQNFLLDIENSILAREQFIQREFTNYTFDTKEIIDNTKKIQAKLLPINDVSVKANIQKNSGNIMTLQVTNYHGLPLQVVGFGATNKIMRDSLKSIQLLEVNIKGNLPVYQELKARGDVSYIYYKVPGVDSVFHSEISLWSIPVKSVPIQELFENINIETNQYYEVEGNLISFRQKEMTVSSDIIIPEGYTVRFDAGTTLNFTRRAKFISKSPVYMAGREDAPIKVRSGDKSANGFTVLEAAERSVLRHVVFKNMRNLNYKKWRLSGSVTFYDSEVIFEECSFIGSQSDQSLNLIRSDFEIKDCNFNNSGYDALVAEFSEGFITGSVFYGTKNDALTLLHTDATVLNCNIQNTNNYGIVAGEEAKVDVDNLTLKKAYLGVVSRDYSELNILSVDLMDCNIGFTVFQNKSSYKSSELLVEKYTAVNVEKLKSVQPGSLLILNGKEDRGF